MQCKRCLYTSDHPLGIVLDEEGICSGCRIHEEKDKLDWDYRKDKLQRLVKNYRAKKISHTIASCQFQAVMIHSLSCT